MIAAVVRRGFTLVEMLLVLTVLLILAGISYVVLSTQYDEYALKDATEQVRTNLANTRNLAVESGVTYQFRYEPNGRRYVIIPYEVDSDAISDSQDPRSSGTGSLAQRYRMISSQLPKGTTFAKADDPGVTSATEQVIPIAKEFLQAMPNPTALQGVGWGNPILFLPDGTATATTFRVQDEKKRYRELSVRELTAAVSVGPVTLGGR